MRVIAVALVLLLGLSGVTYAAPPVGSTGEHSEFFRGMKMADGITGCCNESDCRFTNIVTKDDGKRYAMITKELFGIHAPDDWVQIPDNMKPNKTNSPLPIGVACFSSYLLCYALPGSGL